MRLGVVLIKVMFVFDVISRTQIIVFISILSLVLDPSFMAGICMTNSLALSLYYVRFENLKNHPSEANFAHRCILCFPKPLGPGT
jgi:hypothetical protein